MEDTVLEKKYIPLTTKVMWCFWNILIALIPVFAWSILTQNPVDLWSGTISCASALSGSVAFTVFYSKEKDWDSKFTQYIALFLVGFLLLLALFSFKEVSYFKEIIIDFWYCSYIAFFILLLPVIFYTFKNEFEKYARTRDRALTIEKQEEEERIIKDIAQRSTNIDIN